MSSTGSTRALSPKSTTRVHSGPVGRFLQCKLWNLRISLKINNSCHFQWNKSSNVTTPLLQMGVSGTVACSEDGLTWLKSSWPSLEASRHGRSMGSARTTVETSSANPAWPRGTTRLPVETIPTSNARRLTKTDRHNSATTHQTLQ